MNLLTKNKYQITVTDKFKKEIVYTDIIYAISYVKANKIANKIIKKNGYTNMLWYEIRIIKM